MVVKMLAYNLLLIIRGYMTLQHQLNRIRQENTNLQNTLHNSETRNRELRHRLATQQQTSQQQKKELKFDLLIERAKTWYFQDNVSGQKNTTVLEARLAQSETEITELQEYIVHGVVQNAIENVVAQNKPVIAQRTGWNSWKGYLFRGIAFHEFASLAKNEDIIFPSPMLRLKQTFLGNKEAPQLLELSSISEMKKETSVESLLPVSAEKIYDCAVEVCVHNSVTLPLPFNCTFTILNLFS